MAGTPTTKVISAVAYGISSILLVMVNKRVLYTYKFGSPVALLLLHLTFSLGLLILVKRLGLMSMRPFDWKLAFKMAPLSFCFVFNILVSFFALGRTSVPMFTTLRRMTTMFVLLLQWKILQIRPSATVVKCVVLMMLGAVIAGLGDLAYDPMGYLYVFINNTFTAGYLVAMKFYFGSLKLEAVEVLRYNCAMSVPIILVICVLNGEFWTVIHSSALSDPNFLAIFLTSGVLAFMVNLTTYWCTQVNTPLTTSVTGQLKNVLTTVLGMLLFPDVHINPMFLFGIGVGTLGGVFYSAHKFMESQMTRTSGKLDCGEDGPETDALESGKLGNENGKTTLVRSRSVPAKLESNDNEDHTS